jgi:hypothetical protein
MSPLQAMAKSKYEELLEALPMVRGEPSAEFDLRVPPLPPEPPPFDPMAGVSLGDRRRMDDAHTRMTEMNQELIRMMNAQRNASAPREDVGQPVGALTPPPEEPNYGGMTTNLRNPPSLRPEEPRVPLAGDDGIGGLFRSGSGTFVPAPTPGEQLLRDYGKTTTWGGRPAPSPLARAAMPTKADRMATRRDNMMAARDIMDRYIGGERNAMPRRSMAPGMRGMAEGKARRAMPVAPRAPMIDRSEPQPYMRDQMPNIKPFSAEEIAEYSKGRTFSPEGRYAKGGRVSKGEKKIGKVMGEYKRGELHSGSKKGPVVTNPKQAKAIALSEARAAGAKIPKKAMGGKACG